MMKIATAWAFGIASSVVVGCAAPPIGEPLAGSSEALDNGAGKTTDATSTTGMASGASGTFTMTCRSANDTRVTCGIPAHGRVVAVSVSAQLSEAPCVLGQSFGRSTQDLGGERQDGIWVDHGCSAVFEVTYQPNSPAPSPAPAPVAICRGYNGTVGDHLQGTLDGEGTPAWLAEGVGFHIYPNDDAGNLVALYSCLRESDGHHFLSSVGSDCEGNTLIGLLGYLSPTPADGLQALVRCVNEDRDDHLSTTNADECTSPGFANEGVQGYVLP